MAWPSGTKASTANVDAGSDLISNARADIKQNIDTMFLFHADSGTFTDDNS